MVNPGLQCPVRGLEPGKVFAEGIDVVVDGSSIRQVFLTIVTVDEDRDVTDGDGV